MTNETIKKVTFVEEMPGHLTSRRRTDVDIKPDLKGFAPYISLSFGEKKKNPHGGHDVPVYLNAKRVAVLHHYGSRYSSWSFEDEHDTPWFLKKATGYPNHVYDTLPRVKKKVTAIVQAEVDRMARELLSTMTNSIMER